MPAGVPNLLVMLSGGGRTFLNLAAAIDRGELRARVAAVVASRECPGAEAARRMGLPVRVLSGEIAAADLAGVVQEFGAAWVVLAGYLKRVHLPESLGGRVVNIHPSLLPKFGGPGMYGRRVHEAVLAAGERESGCTVHLCDAEYDRGSIILQARVPVLEGDTPETLAERVFAAECRAYPRALGLLLEGRAGV